MLRPLARVVGALVALVAACSSFEATDDGTPETIGDGGSDGDASSSADGAVSDGGADALSDGVAPFAGRPSRLALGNAFTCVVLEDAAVDCWGTNDHGELGAFDGGSSSVPVRVSGLPPVQGLAAGHEHVCAIDVDGGVWCWGNNSSGQLGTGDLGGVHPPGRALAPEGFAGYLHDVSALGLGNSYSCAILDGGVYCAGGNGQVELALDAGSGSKARFRLVALPSRANVVAVGSEHACAASDDGVMCWGLDDLQQCGVDAGGVLPPTRADTGDAGRATALALGSTHSCLLDESGRTWCWGGSTSCGAVGPTPGLPAHEVGTSRSDLSAAAFDTCTVTTAGAVACVGSNASGQLGIGTVSSGCPNSNETVIPDLRASTLAIGGAHACALPVDGGAVCWGANDAGELGTGNHDPSAQPAAVTW